MNSHDHSGELSDETEPEKRERAVGITVLAAPSVPGFKCTIKRRYTDFLVNEILPDGHVLHLTDLTGQRSGNGKHKARRGDQVMTTQSNGHLQKDDDLESTKRKDVDGDDEYGNTTTSPRKKQKLHDATGQVLATEATSDDASTSKADRMAQIIAAVPEADKQALQGIFDKTVADDLFKLYANVVIHPNRKPRDHPFVTSNVITEKSKRTEAHVAIRRIFSSKLETATMPDTPGVISIKAAPTKGPSGPRARPDIDEVGGAYQKGKVGWDDLGGEYLHFSLYKENKDTMEVLYYIASGIKVPVKNFQFAGTKDRRGVTVQRVAIFRVHANRIADLNQTARGWRAGDFEYKKHGLELGELQGNEFVLTLKNCSFDGEAGLPREQQLDVARRVLDAATTSFKATGFLNYYGLQRFGSFTTGTHSTGQKILSGDLEGAVKTILHCAGDINAEAQVDGAKVPQDDIDRANAIKLWRDGQGKEACATMPRRFQAEAAVIQYLSKEDRKTGKAMQERDWQGALTRIPRNLRLMYVHAYQSFVWNTVAGKRWDMFGRQVVKGDLVIVGEKGDESGASKDEVDEDGEPVFHPAQDDSAPSAAQAFTRARPLSKEEAASGKFDLFDVVLPLPGYDVLYPANAIGKYYEEFMASESGGAIDPHNMRRSWKDMSLSGAYRKLMARPGKDLSFDVRSYLEDEEQLVETDLERIERREGSGGSVQAVEGAGSDDKAETPPGQKVEKIAVVLKMQLGSSQYATMALRELTKGGALHYTPDFSSR